MLYRYNRTDIVKMIKKRPLTNDNNYWFPYFDDINSLPGNEKDDDYYYDRNLFKFKLYFTPRDIKLYLSKKKIYDIDVDELYRLDLKFYETNFFDIKDLELNDYVIGNDFTVENLIDCNEYINNLKL